MQIRSFLLFFFMVFLTATALAVPESATERNRGEGPFDRLVLRGGIVIDGEGAPARGPVDIVIRGNKITTVKSVGSPGVPILSTNRPKISDSDKVIDISGYYVLPGFVDLHGHFGGDSQGVSADYVTRLWLAHGITTIREPGSGNGLAWVLDHMRRSEANTIAAPRIIPFVTFGADREEPITTADQARSWVQQIARKGAKGIKFFGHRPEIMRAALDEAKKQGLGSAMHHDQLNVAHWNALDSARAGLDTMEHWYGLPEALFVDKSIQAYPDDYNYNNEQHRFGEAGRLWQQAAAPGSERWNAVRDELIALDFTINPTLTIYEASRDLMREMNADWHEDYVHPNLWKYFQPSGYAHGSYWFDWTTQKEIDWKNNLRIWMQFLNDYKNHGGRVTTGSDSGFIWKVYGFGYIRELELLQEAGFHPLEVVRAATIDGARVLGMDDQIGSIQPGKLADLVIVKENPLHNFKVLYGTGHFMLDEHGQAIRTDGIEYTIKDGIIYRPAELLEDVRGMVRSARVISRVDR